MVDILCRLDPVRKLEAGLEHLPGFRLKPRPLDGTVDSPSAPVVVELVHPYLREVPGSRPRRPRGRRRRAGSARARPQGRSCRSAAWGCVASACRRRWRATSRGSRFGCSPRRRTAGRPRRPSRRSRPARLVCGAAPACRWRRRRNGAWRACPASGLIRFP